MRSKQPLGCKPSRPDAGDETKERQVAVLVLDRGGKPLMPCSEKRARKLLAAGRARIQRLMHPFVIRLVDRRVERSRMQPLRIKVDPGSKTTGLALVRDVETGCAPTREVHREAAVLNLFELVLRGHQISETLTQRRAFRRRRRSNLKYRAPRFTNRRRPEGWLAPSLQHRVDTTLAWVKRLMRWAPITAISSELVRFDLQQMEKPEISGVEYQQGALFGFELREYVLHKFGHRCAYCDAGDRVLNLDHVVPKARGGSDRVSNLAPACVPCNEKKRAQPIEQFLARDPKRLARIQATLKTPLKDAAAVNATRWALANALQATELPVELTSGGRTKFNRQRLGIPKAHALDAACVGDVDRVTGWHRPTLSIKCTGRGRYQRTRLDAYGFPRGYLIRQKQVHGFQTGDLVMAVVPSGKKTGIHVGRVAVRASGYFNIQRSEVVQGISYKHCRVLQRGDGYGYHQISTLAVSSQAAFAPATEVASFPERVL